MIYNLNEEEYLKLKNKSEALDYFKQNIIKIYDGGEELNNTVIIVIKKAESIEGGKLLKEVINI